MHHEKVIIDFVSSKHDRLMNIIRKHSLSDAINRIKKRRVKRHISDELKFELGRIPRKILSKLLVVCGRVDKENMKAYEEKASEIGADFVHGENSWVLTRNAIREVFDRKKHEAVLLIGNNKELPAIQIGYEGVYAWTDFFLQDLNCDLIPDTPVGRVFGPAETVLYHMDPTIIDSNIAIIFDSQPGRSMRHVEGLEKLDFDVEVVRKYNQEDKRLLEVAEFILQFSDGMYSSRIHGTPEKWASHNSTILTHNQASSLQFEGYPVIYSEACSTAREGLLLKAFLQQGSIYIGATLETLNNVKEFDDWTQCPFADGWKFGFLDLLDSFPYIGQVKLNVDKTIYQNLESEFKQGIENVRTGEEPMIESQEVLSTIEWMFFGNPLRSTTVGPQADFKPGLLIVDT